MSMRSTFSKLLSKLLLCVALLAFMAKFAIAEDYYQQAHSYYRNADTRAAIIQLKNLLQQEPKHRDGRLLLGKIYLENNQFPAAENELQRALRLDIPIEQVAPSMVAALIGLQRYQDALDFIDRHWRADQGDQAQRWVLSGNAYLGLQAWPQAEQAFYQSIAIGTSPEATLGLARVAGARGEPEQALGLLTSIDGNDAVGLQALLLRGQIHLSQREGNQALNAFGQVLEREPDNLLAHLRRAQAAIMVGQVESAADDIRLLLDKTPLLPEVRLVAALAALTTQDYRNADTHASMLLQQAPNSLQGLLIAGIASYHQGQFEEAASHLQAVLSQVPGQTAVMRYMAATLLKQNKAKQAMKLLEPFIDSGVEDTTLTALAGNAALRTGDWETAENLLSQSMAAFPDNDSLVNQVALSRLLGGREGDAIQLLDQQAQTASVQSDVVRLAAFVRGGEIAKARTLLQTQIAANPDKITYRLLLANFELQQGNAATARTVLDATANVAPEHPAPQMGLARLDLLNNAPEQAKQRYRKILSTQPNHLPALLGMSMAAKAMRDAKEAVYWLQQARQRQPEAIHPVRLLVRHYLAAKTPDKALSEAQAFYLGREKRQDAALLYAASLRMTGSAERAELILQRLLLDNPDSLQGQAAMAEALRDQGRVEEGLKYTTRLYESIPDALPALLLHADLLVRSNDDAKARDVLNASWRDQPTAAVARRLGVLDARQGRWTSAKQYFAQAHQGVIDPPLLRMILEVERQIAGPAGMRALLDQYLTTTPDDAFARLQLATLQQQQGEPQAAIQQYEAVKRLQPANPVAWNNLAWLYFSAGDPRSLAHAQESHRLAPNSPDIQDTLGWILLNTGDPQQGLEMLSRALKGLPNNIEVRYHRAVALAANQRHEEARFALLRLSKEDTSFQQEIETLLQQLN